MDDRLVKVRMNSKPFFTNKLFFAMMEYPFSNSHNCYS